MIENVGQKLKSASFLFFTIGAITSLIVSLHLYVIFDRGIAGLVIAGGVFIVGCILAWIGVLALHGLGQLVENSDIIRAKMEEPADKTDADENTDINVID